MRIILNGNRQCRDMLCRFSLRRLPPVLRKMVWDYMLPVTSSLKGITDFPSDPYITTLAKQCPDIQQQPRQRQDLAILLLSIYYSKHDIVFRQTDAQVAVLAVSVYHNEEAVGKFIQMVRLLDEVYYNKGQQPTQMLFRACQVVDPDLVQWLKQWDEGELTLLIRNFVRSYGLALLPLQSSLFICDQLFLKLRKFPLQPYIFLAIALLQIDPQNKTLSAVQPILKCTVPQEYIDSCSQIFQNCRVQFPRHGDNEGARGKLDLVMQGAGEVEPQREQNLVSDTTKSADVQWDDSIWGKRKSKIRNGSVIGANQGGNPFGNPIGNQIGKSIASLASKGSKKSSLKRQSSVSDIDRYFDEMNDSRFLDSYSQEFMAPQKKR